MLVRSSLLACYRRGARNAIVISSERNWAVAHARRGAQCRDDGGDDAADNLEDGLPRFLVFHSLCFLSFLVSVN